MDNGEDVKQHCIRTARKQQTRLCAGESEIWITGGPPMRLRHVTRFTRAVFSHIGTKNLKKKKKRAEKKKQRRRIGTRKARRVKVHGLI